MKKVGEQIKQRKSNSNKAAAVVFDRVIICLTKKFQQQNGTIMIPRSSENMNYLCKHNLKGRILLNSNMDEEEIMDEIRLVFQDSFTTFLSFDILQHGGGRLKSLVVPSLSSSYAWTASAVAGSSKSPIYILAHNDDLVAAMETSERDLPEVTFAKKKGMASILFCK